jgi:hypothetical protein
MAVPDPNQVDGMMTLSGTLSQLDQLLHLGWNYYDSVFETPNWRSNDDVFELGPLEMFYHHMVDGQSFLERSLVNEAFEHFNRAFDLIHHLLSRQTFLFLPYLYHMILATRQVRRQEVFCRLLDFASRMAKTGYLQLNPFQRSLTLLARTSVEDRSEVSERAFKGILNSLRVEFEADIPDQFELLSSIVCQERANSDLERSLGHYKVTFVAVSKLAKDVEVLDRISRQEQMHRAPHPFSHCHTSPRYSPDGLIAENSQRNLTETAQRQTQAIDRLLPNSRPRKSHRRDSRSGLPEQSSYNDGNWITRTNTNVNNVSRTSFAVI